MPKLDTNSGGSSRNGGRRARGVRVSTSLAEINVVPLVDVMLVLLVIFMVAAPMMQQGFPVKLPQARRAAAANAPITVTVPMSFRKDARVQIDDEFVSFGALPERIRQVVVDRTDKSVMLSGDGGISYSELVAVMDGLREGGVVTVNLQVQPAVGRGR